MTPADATRLAQIRRDYGALSEDAYGHAGALAFVLRLLGEAEAEVASLTATEEQAIYDRDCSWRHIAKARRQAIEECAQAAYDAMHHGTFNTNVLNAIRALAKPEKEPT